jgi:hypothetical protein
MSLLIALILVYGFNMESYWYYIAITIFSIEKFLFYKNVKDVLNILGDNFFLIKLKLGIMD